MVTQKVFKANFEIVVVVVVEMNVVEVIKKENQDIKVIENPIKLIEEI